jgi:hypothetical protein
VALLRPEEQVFAAMLDAWREQQLARNLAFGTIEKRLAVVRAFAAHADAPPWAWRPQLLDEWLGDLRSVRRLRRTTIRNYGSAVAAFCSFVTDPAYGWAAECAGSTRTQCRWSTSGTPRCTPRTSRATRVGGRSPSTSCRRCSTTPTSRSPGSGPPACPVRPELLAIVVACPGCQRSRIKAHRV